MKKTISNKLARRTTSIFAAIVIVLSQLAAPAAVFANGNGSPAECLGSAANVVGSIGGEDNSGSANLVVYDAGDGKVVEGVCIKSGENMFGGNKHSDVLGNGNYENGCYTVSGVGTQTVTVTRNSDSSTCQGISHIDVVTKNAVDFCDPSQKPSGSIYNWLTSQNPVPQCVDYEVTTECGGLSVLLTQNDTPYNYGFSYSVGAIDWNYNTDASSITFPEDYNGGSVEVFFWGVGPEADYFTALNFPWYQVSAESRVIDTDCNDPEPGKIRGFKFNDLNGNGKFNKKKGETKLSGWTIFIDGNSNGVLDQGEESKVTNSNGGYAFRNLLAGTYRICEVQQPGWAQTFPASDGCHDVTLSAGEDKKGVKFGNKEIPQTPDDGFLGIFKDTDPDDEQDFHFTITGDNQFSDSFDLDDDGDDNNTLSSWKGYSLEPGYYTITEDQVDGWTLDDASCEGVTVQRVSNGIRLYVDSNDELICTFTNVKEDIPTPTTPQVLGDITQKVTPKQQPQVLAVTGESYDWRGSAMAVTLLGAVLATVTRRKEEKA